ncbi:RloB family protein [Marinomonas primoryensis]|uniref:RloB family protein n=1 Tax=Marinomonas primoryensis TaxID=178399 RepID=A0ABV0L5A9_9GAMM
MPKRKKKAVKELKKKLHIVCEGEKTEPNYLRSYIRDIYSQQKLLDVIDIPDIRVNTPKALVSAAKQLKKTDAIHKDDIYWVVYDREEVSECPDNLHKQAYDDAKRNNINVAFSNVCFELWILLHFTKTTAAYTSFINLKSQSNLILGLKSLGMKGSYEKGDQDIYHLIKNGVLNARKEAKIMNKLILNASIFTEEEPYKLNPYTNFYELLDAIDNFLSPQNKKQIWKKIHKIYHNPWLKCPYKNRVS